MLKDGRTNRPCSGLQGRAIRRLLFREAFQDQLSGRSALLLNCLSLPLAEDVQDFCTDRIYGIAPVYGHALSTITGRVDLRNEESDF